MGRNDCNGCGANISDEERRAGSTNGFCVICEHISNTPQQRAARRIELTAQRERWDQLMRERFPRQIQKEGK